MTDLRDSYAAAIRLHRAGRIEAAAARYREILRAAPAHGDALHMLGVIAMAQGDAAAAFDCFARAVAAMPDNAGFCNNLGVAARALGRVDAAVDAFRRALACDPTLVDARGNLGNALLAQGDAAAAIAEYRKALEGDPGDPGDRGDPGDAALRGNLALAYRVAGDLDAAAAIWRALVAGNPDSAAAQNGLGVVLAESGRVAEAVACYRRALDSDPDCGDAANNLGVALLAKGRGAAAETCFRDLLARDGGSAAVLANLGNALRRQGKVAAAARAYRDALAIAPGDDGVRARLATLLPVIAPSTEAMAAARRDLAASVAELRARGLRLDDPEQAVGATHFHLSYHDCCNRDLHRAIAGLYLDACPALGWVAPHCRAGGAAGRGTGRIRVGFVSRHFRDHAVGWCYQGILRRLSREGLAVTAFTFAGAEDALWRAIAADVDEAVVLPATLAGAREGIARAALDVLVYTDIGMEPLTYFLAFARLAAVQCATNGHPDTTGIPAIDHFIGDAALEPSDAASHYSENLALLDGALVDYARPAPKGPPRPRAAYGLPEDGTVYLCPQSLFKIHPSMDAPLATILARDRAAYFVVFEGPEPHWAALLRARWQAAMGADFARVRFLPRLPFDDFLHVLGLADVMLDTWPFGGGNTSYQGLAMATPIVTWPGRFARGRATAALYRRIGVVEGIANSPQEYVAIALRLGTEPDFRARLREAIAARADALFDDRRAVAEFARFLESVGRPSGRR